MFDDDDDDDLEDEAFGWGALHTLHTYAYHASCGRIRGVRIAFGLCLIDAIKNEKLTEVTAEPYAQILMEALETGERPRWH